MPIRVCLLACLFACVYGLYLGCFSPWILTTSRSSSMARERPAISANAGLLHSANAGLYCGQRRALLWPTGFFAFGQRRALHSANGGRLTALPWARTHARTHRGRVCSKERGKHLMFAHTERWPQWDDYGEVFDRAQHTLSAVQEVGSDSSGE